MNRRFLVLLACLLLAAVCIAGKMALPNPPAPSDAVVIATAQADARAGKRMFPAGGSWHVTRTDKHQVMAAYLTADRHRFYAQFMDFDAKGVLKEHKNVGGGFFLPHTNIFPLGSPQLTKLWIPLMMVTAIFLVTVARGRRRVDAAIASLLPLNLVAFQTNELFWCMLLGPLAMVLLGLRIWFDRDETTTAPNTGRVRQTIGKVERIVQQRRWALLLWLPLVAFAWWLCTVNTKLIDVGQAGLAGASLLWDGQTPYGAIPWIFHGDTYPLLAYVAYMPAAFSHPAYMALADFSWTVYSMFAYWLIACWSMYRAALRLELEFPMLTTAVLAMCPSLLLIIGTGNSDVVLALCILLSLSGSMWWLAVGAWVKVLPIALLLPRLRRDNLRGPLGLTVACLVVAMLVGGGPHGAIDMMQGMIYQITRGSAWDAAYLVSPVFAYAIQTAGLGLVFAGMVRVWGLRTDPVDPRRWLATSLLCYLGFQSMSTFWNPFYVGWLMPILGLWVVMTPRILPTSSSTPDSSEQSTDTVEEEYVTR
jgi:hypothetical protein